MEDIDKDNDNELRKLLMEDRLNLNDFDEGYVCVCMYVQGGKYQGDSPTVLISTYYKV